MSSSLCLPDFKGRATEFCLAVLSIRRVLESQLRASFKQVVSSINPFCVGFWQHVFDHFDLRTVIPRVFAFYPTFFLSILLIERLEFLVSVQFCHRHPRNLRYCRPIVRCALLPAVKLPPLLSFVDDSQRLVCFRSVRSTGESVRVDTSSRYSSHGEKFLAVFEGNVFA